MVSFAEDSSLDELLPALARARRGDLTPLPVGPRECGCHTGERRSGFVNSVRCDPTSRTELAERITDFLNCGSSHVVHFLAAHPTVLARRDETYRDLLNRGDLNVPDGMAVTWALRLFGCRAERLAGSDAMSFLCGWGVERMTRHYLFGGAPAVVARLRARLEARFAGIQVVGAESPPFRRLSDEEWVGAADRIRRAGADVVWVGLGAPKQDRAAERLRTLQAAPAILCVGAAFDFLSGTQRRAPQWVQEGGLEWLHRWIHEPTRLSGRYLKGNSRFIAGVARDYLAGARAR